MLNDIIKLGDKLTVLQLDVKNKNEYQSKLLDMSDDGFLSITMPIDKGKIVVMDIGAKYRLSFFNEKGMYSCDAVVVERHKTRRIYIAKLQVSSDFTKIQRRGFFRLHHITQLEYCEVPKKEFNEVIRMIEKSNTTYGLSSLDKKLRAIEFLQEEDRIKGTVSLLMKKALSRDISAGGIRLRSSEPIQQEENLLLIFVLKGLKYEFKLFGKLVSCEMIDAIEKIYESRIEFTDIKDEDREKIVHYVISEERKILQKEKGFY